MVDRLLEGTFDCKRCRTHRGVRMLGTARELKVGSGTLQRVKAAKRVTGAGARTEGREASRQTSEVGAVCRKAARTVLCGMQAHER
jgi:hypothetical protein